MIKRQNQYLDLSQNLTDKISIVNISDSVRINRAKAILPLKVGNVISDIKNSQQQNSSYDSGYNLLFSKTIEITIEAPFAFQATLFTDVGLFSLDMYLVTNGSDGVKYLLEDNREQI